MKKKLLVLLAAALCLLSVSVQAESATGKGDIVIRNDGLAAYVDGKGNLLIPGNEQPVNEQTADAVVAINPYHLVFLSKSDAADGAETASLVSIDLTTFEESMVAENVHAACLVDEDRLYYIPKAERTQICMTDLEGNAASVVYTAAEELDRLFVSVEGLVATYADNAGAVVYVSASDTFEEFSGSIPSQNLMTEEYQLYIAPGSELSLFRPESFAADILDSNVYSFEMLNGKIYYFAHSGSALRLKSYDPTTMEWKVVTTPEVPLETKLTSSAGSLFALGMDQVIYEIDPESGAMTAFAVIDSHYDALPADGSREVDSYSIRAMDGQLNLYATITEANAQPAFSFVEFSTDVSGDEGKETVLLETFPIEGENGCWELLEPAQQYAPLVRGMRGEAVSAIQQPLYNLGYYDYYIDGIFGHRTERAVRILQGDLGRTVNGIADEELQRLILGGTLPAYDPYRQVDYGSRGLRTEMLQQRLRALGYLADSADGIYGGRTRTAVQLFQWENGLQISENATREMLIALYSGNAARCSSYIPLRQGDSGIRVRELNNRLKELYYLEGSGGSTYTSATADAVRKYQSQVGLSITGEASVVLQQRLFNKNAQEYTGHIVLRRGDENTRVYRLQRRLKELNYFTANPTGYFGRKTQEAVKLFQQKVGIRPTGEATIATQELLYSPNAPKYVKPTILGTPAITIDTYEKIENGVYFLTDESAAGGSVTFSWMTEGQVASYHVSIIDTEGNVYLDQDTLLTRTGVSVGTLEMNRVYTLKVTAKPQDGDASHETSAEISFCRIEAPKEPEIVVGTITGVHASVEPVVRTENDVDYVRSGVVTFRWYAEGDVASYYVEIRDSNDKLLLPTNTTDEEASISTDAMRADETYTLYVYAIPTNGTVEHATVQTKKFALETEPEPLPQVSAPVVEAENTSAETDENGNAVYVVADDPISFRWNAVEYAAQYYIEILDASGTSVTGETTTETTYILNPAMLSKGAEYTMTVAAIPEGGIVTPEATTAIVLDVEEDQTVIQMPAPVLSILNSEPAGDGIAYSDDEILTFQWTSVEGAVGYNVVVRDGSQNICHEETVAELSMVYNASSLTRGAVYTVTVTAVPAEDANAQGTPATLPFIIRIASVPVEIPEENTSEEDIPALPIELGEPQITVSEIDEIIDSVVYVQEGTVSFTWKADGAVSAYYAAIYDADNELRTEVTSSDIGASITSDKLIRDAVYTLRVVAIPEGGTIEDGAASEVRFGVRSAEAAEEEIPAVADIPVSESANETVPEEIIQDEAETEMVENSVSAPEISIHPTLYTEDSVHYVQNGMISMEWYADGEVEGYSVEILNSANGIVASMTTSDTATRISAENMTAGEIYTLRVVAIPAGGSVKDGKANAILFAKEFEEPAEAEISEIVDDNPASEEPVYEEMPAEEVQTEEIVPEEIVPEETYEEPSPVQAEEPASEPIEDPAEPLETEPAVIGPWEVPLTAESDIALISELQLRLVEWGWLAPESFADGMLDEATILAVISFQTSYNEANEVMLTPVLPEDPVIESETLMLLMAEEAIPYTNPNA